MANQRIGRAEACGDWLGALRRGRRGIGGRLGALEGAGRIDALKPDADADGVRTLPGHDEIARGIDRHRRRRLLASGGGVDRDLARHRAPQQFQRLGLV